MTRGGQTYYYQLNGHGDVAALTDAWGNIIKETGNIENPYRYLGYRYDEVTGAFTTCKPATTILIWAAS
jgi:hypothetical protein